MKGDDTKMTEKEEALKDTEVIVIAVPTFAVRSVLKQIKPYLVNKPYIVSVAKGFDPETFERMSEVVRSEIPDTLRKEVVSLIGPGHAEEVILRKLTCITATSINKDDATIVQRLFSTPYFRVYVQTDEVGAEYGVAIKNAIAIASGIWNRSIARRFILDASSSCGAFFIPSVNIFSTASGEIFP